MKNLYSTILILFFAQIAFGQLGGGNGNHPTCEQEGFPPGSTRWFRDVDNDQFGDDNVTTCSVTKPNIGGYNWVTNNTDCDDTDANLPNSNFWVDSDGDGYGDPNQKIPFLLCSQPNGYATNGDDCNDNDSTEWQGQRYYFDNDGDGYAASSAVFGDFCSSSPPANYTTMIGDCDDNDASVYNGAPDICDGKDNDCDGQLDEDVPNAPSLTSSTGPICGSGTATFTMSHNNTGGNYTYRWYANSSLVYESANNTFTTPVLTQNKSYRVAIFDGVSNCESSQTSIGAFVNPLPGAPQVSEMDLCGSYVIDILTQSGETYYWQNSATGTSTADSDLNKTFTSGSNTLYVRARNTTNCWGPATQIDYSVRQAPATPLGTAVSVLEECGLTTISHTGPSDASTWYWQETAGGTDDSPANADSSIQLNEGSTYYLRAKIGLCWSDALQIQYTVPGSRIVAPTIDGAETCGPGEIVLYPEYPGLLGPDDLITYNFYDMANTLLGSVAYGSTFTATISETTTYQVRVQFENGCEGPMTNVTATVNIANNIYYYDGDGDGLGDPFTPSELSCVAPDNYVADNSDDCPYINDPTNTCDSAVDTNATHNPDNYIYSRAYQTEGAPALAFFTPSDNLIQEITYFDGLGRPRQQIAIDQTPGKNDLITHIGFDGFNRTEREWLPYADTNGALASYRNTAMDATETWYEQEYGDELSVSAPNPFSQKHFELSPLNRVLKQGAPGEAWLVNPNGEDNAIEFEYQSNSSNEVRKYRVTTSNSVHSNTFVPTLGEDGHYLSGELAKMVTKDENHSGSSKLHTTEEFTDKNGRVVLKRTYALVSGTETAHDTHYVYDDHGNLTYVIPPLVDVGNGVSDDELRELCYQYTYDHRDRLVVKQLPGKEKEYIVYNALDQPIMTQDANQRANGEWLFTKYDAFGRVAYTGKAVDAQDRTEVQDEVNALSTDLWVANGSFTNGGLDIGYGNTAYPTNTVTEVLTVNYYDNYGFDRTNEPAPPATVFDEAIDDRTQGLATGSKVRVLDTDDWITTVIRYDAKGRVIYTHTQNDYLNSVDLVTSDLDFVGRPNTVRSSHSKNGTTIVTLDTFTYDHVGRLLTQTQCIGDGTLGDTCPSGGSSGTTVEADLPLSGTITTDQLATQAITVSGTAIISGTVTLRVDAAANNGNGTGQELIVSNSYDKLGQLQHKKVGGDATGNGLQTVDYSYNVRGWLKTINQDQNNDNDLFDFELRYNDPTNFGGAENPVALYNGNISQVLWGTQSTNNTANPVSNRYSYVYDALNRIKAATDNTGNYNLANVGYDKNGNITGLQRLGPTGPMDDLTYNYYENEASNRLQRVSDASNNAEGFNDRQATTEEYGYDANGNMTRDDNKGITLITYNHLNLPVDISITNSDHTGIISYIYDATGVKLRKQVGSMSTEYAGNYIYENGSLQFMNHSEGYTAPDNSGGYDYVYQYKDHLGNVRLSYAENPTSPGSATIIEESNYYPFGLKHKGYNTGGDTALGNDVAQKWKFGGKEYDESLGLETYDFGARNYSPDLGRWMNIDPLAEEMRRHSPYNYAFNNPIFFLDPDGMAPLDVFFIHADGNIERYETNDGVHTFVTLDSDHNIQSVTTLTENESGLVEFPSSGDGFGRYGTNDAGGTDTRIGETVGQGDHFVTPETAAALFGVVDNLGENLNISLGDMSSSNGSDPWQPGFKHHGGHGHNGKRSGLDVDFRYADNEGGSIGAWSQGDADGNAFDEGNFSQSNNQSIFGTALKFGFDKNYHGTKGSGFSNAKPLGGHNDHGHIGRSSNNNNIIEMGGTVILTPKN